MAILPSTSGVRNAQGVGCHGRKAPDPDSWNTDARRADQSAQLGPISTNTYTRIPHAVSAPRSSTLHKAQLPDGILSLPPINLPPPIRHYLLESTVASLTLPRDSSFAPRPALIQHLGSSSALLCPPPPCMSFSRPLDGLDPSSVDDFAKDLRSM